MGEVKLQFSGGFAWVFAATGTATAGLVKAPPGSSYPHKMIVAVDRSRVAAGTTHAEAGTSTDDEAHYELLGPVSLTIDGQPLPPHTLTRMVSTSLPSDPNDFFHVYGIERLGGAAPLPLKRDWRDHLTVRVALSAGALSVSDARRIVCTFEDDNGTPVGDKRALATIVTYTSSVAAKSHVDIADDSGIIRLSAAQDLVAQVNAKCDCGAVPVQIGDRLPGFEDVFELYPPLQPKFRIHPVKAGEIQPSGVLFDRGPITPGPDCPPTEHPEP